LTLTAQLAENTAAIDLYSGTGCKRQMLRALALKLCVVLLATSVVVAPVLGSMPRCCKTGAVAGGGNCCCAERQQADTAHEAKEAAEGEEAADCCAARPKSCCAENATAIPPPVNDIATFGRGAVESRCSCRITQPLAAVPGSKDRGESRDELSAIPVSSGILAAAHFPAVTAAEHNERPLLRISLHKMYCRWTV